MFCPLCGRRMQPENATVVSRDGYKTTFYDCICGSDGFNMHYSLVEGPVWFKGKASMVLAWQESRVEQVKSEIPH